MHLLLVNGGVVVGQHGDQGIDVLELGSEAGADDIVAGSHALDNVARDVGVDVVGAQEKSLAGGHGDVVAEEEDKQAVVGAEVGVAAGDEAGEGPAGGGARAACSEVVWVLVGLVEEGGGGGVESGLGPGHQGAKQALEGSLIVALGRVGLVSLVRLDGVGKSGGGFLPDEGAQGADGVEEVCDLCGRSEATQALEVGEGNGHLGLVVVIGVVGGVAFVELLGQLLVGVGLDGQGFGDGEDLEEEGQTLPVAGNGGLGEESFVVVDEVEKGPACADVSGRIGGVGAHPELEDRQSDRPSVGGWGRKSKRDTHTPQRMAGPAGW